MEEKRQSTLEVAQEEDATQKTGSQT